MGWRPSAGRQIPPVRPPFLPPTDHWPSEAASLGPPPAPRHARHAIHIHPRPLRRAEGLGRSHYRGATPTLGTVDRVGPSRRRRGCRHPKNPSCRYHGQRTHPARHRRRHCRRGRNPLDLHRRSPSTAPRHATHPPCRRAPTTPCPPTRGCMPAGCAKLAVKDPARPWTKRGRCRLPPHTARGMGGAPRPPTGGEPRPTTRSEPRPPTRGASQLATPGATACRRTSTAQTCGAVSRDSHSQSRQVEQHHSTSLGSRRLRFLIRLRGRVPGRRKKVGSRRGYAEEFSNTSITGLEKLYSRFDEYMGIWMESAKFLTYTTQSTPPPGDGGGGGRGGGRGVAEKNPCDGGGYRCRFRAGFAAASTAASSAWL